MSQVPSYVQSNAPFAKPRLSAASITSFVLGLLLCIPVITSLLAIVFAVLGMRAARNGLAGRGFAITGLIFGIFGLVIWSGVGALVGVIISASAAPRAVLHDFARDVAAGDRPAAAALSTPAMTPDGFDKVRDYIRPFGTYGDLTCTGAYLGNNSGTETCRLNGTAHFSAGPHPFTATLINDRGTWKIEGFHIW